MAQIGYAKDLAVVPRSRGPVVPCGPSSTSEKDLSLFEVLSSNLTCHLLCLCRRETALVFCDSVSGAVMVAL